MKKVIKLLLGCLIIITLGCNKQTCPTYSNFPKENGKTRNL